MRVRLSVRERGVEGGADSADEHLLEQDTITIGRDPKCDVVLKQKAVSRAHARISRDGPLFFVEDLGSAYGTQVNHELLPKGEKRLLRNGDVIAVAQYDLVFDRVADAPKQGGPDTTSYVARSVVKDVMRGLNGGGPYFRVMNGPKEGQRIEIADAQELVIGRDDAVSDVVFKDDLVSRRHVRIRRDWSGTHVEDLESRNGTKVNHKRIRRKTLRDRDEVQVGGVRLLYLDPSEVREAPVVLPEDEASATARESEEERAAFEAEQEARRAAQENSRISDEVADDEQADADGDEDDEQSMAADDEAGEGDSGEDAPEPSEDAELEGEGDLGGLDEDPEASAFADALSVPSKLAFLNRVPFVAKLGGPKALVPMVAVGVLAMLAFGLLIALVVGA